MDTETRPEVARSLVECFQGLRTLKHLSLPRKYWALATSSSQGGFFHLPPHLEILEASENSGRLLSDSIASSERALLQYGDLARFLWDHRDSLPRSLQEIRFNSSLHPLLDRIPEEIESDQKGLPTKLKEVRKWIECLKTINPENPYFKLGGTIPGSLLFPSQFDAAAAVSETSVRDAFPWIQQAQCCVPLCSLHRHDNSGSLTKHI